MDVVHADIGGKPAQDARQVVMRAAEERRRVQVPGPILGPERVLELMLDVEQPDPDGSSKQCDWEVHQQK